MNLPGLPPTIRWEGEETGQLFALDQTLLPETVEEVLLDRVDDAIDAIRRLVVRGAPLIGITAAYAMVLAARDLPDDLPAGQAADALRHAATRIRSVRPTAVNLGWALDRSIRRADPLQRVPELRRHLLAEARAIHREDREACDAMARHASPLVRDGGSYLTHCNAGAMATGGIGTALGVFHRAAAEGKRITVYADETRPLLQGARLTAFELARSGVDVVLQCDSAAAGLLASGAIDAVFVGADRIAANGDTANKLGTLQVAIAAARANVPFHVVAPISTFDLALPDGSLIPIEERAAAEVVEMPGRRIALPGVRVRNPAFDVTPAELLTSIVTERGAIRPVDTAHIATILRG
ncbi:MAG: S-methyl-5-thioribose-1-phosphate isomerase [Planctomycetes bacterium]|nr:S-methyl-5-thioribose-1-phosphate isomerase [Planctomycetota bacterium]